MNFSVIPDNLAYFLVGAWPNGPVGGAALTVFLSIVSALASAVLGLALGIALTQLKGWSGMALRAALGFLRAIPVLMLIFWIYFLLPVVFGMDVPGVGAVAISLSFIGGAYLAHSVSAGIDSLPKEQAEAARALGLGPWTTLRRVILPQALPRMAPSFVNQWVALIKDTSLAYVIGVAELSFVATQVSNRVMVYPAEIYLFVGAIYFILCTIVEVGVGRAAARYKVRSA